MEKVQNILHEIEITEEESTFQNALTVILAKNAWLIA